jgi:hypothetical protein
MQFACTVVRTLATATTIGPARPANSRVVRENMRMTIAIWNVSMEAHVVLGRQMNLLHPRIVAFVRMAIQVPNVSTLTKSAAMESTCVCMVPNASIQLASIQGGLVSVKRRTEKIKTTKENFVSITK